jgi:Fe2+ transport system protein FeoA
VALVCGINFDGKAITVESLERMERLIELGFVEGAKAQLKNLEELLATLSLAKGTKQ